METITKEHTKVYICDVSRLKDEDEYKRALSLVSRERKEKVERLRFREDKLLSLMAELLLIEACRDFGISYEEEKIVSGEHGKPEFLSSKMHFSLAHSEEKAMCVMSDKPVGCDIEKIREINYSVAERFFAKEEASQLAECESEEEAKDAFFKLWTAKESLSKCEGQGLYTSLNSYIIELKNDGVQLKSKSGEAVNYELFTDTIGTGEDLYRYTWCMKV